MYLKNHIPVALKVNFSVPNEGKQIVWWMKQGGQGDRSRQEGNVYNKILHLHYFLTLYDVYIKLFHVQFRICFESLFQNTNCYYLNFFPQYFLLLTFLFYTNEKYATPETQYQYLGESALSSAQNHNPWR